MGLVQKEAPTPDEVAAAIVAIELYLGQIGEAELPPTGWRDSARLASQGLMPVPARARLRWRSAERISRQSGAGLSGVTGL